MDKIKKFFVKMMKKIFSREFITYGVVGVLTTLVNILTFKILFENCAMVYGIANIIALFAAKVFAYVANKIFVFRSHCANGKELLFEITKYIFARGFTGLVDIFGMFFAVEILKADEMITKYILQIIVIILNYILGKKVVFKKNERK